MKKIIFLHIGLNVAGAEIMRLRLLSNIDRRKYDIKICCIGEKGSVGKEIEKLGYKVDELKQDQSSKSIYITYQLIKYLKKEKPDILHCCLFNANFHGRVAALFCGKPILITEEHSEHFQYNGLKFLPNKIIDNLLSHITDFIVCCSEGLRLDIIKKERLPARRVVTIENCLDLEKYKLTTQREEIRRRYNIRDEVVFITVACFGVRKGHIFLIESLRAVKDTGYNFKCFFAGDGSLKHQLQQKCYQLGLADEIIFLGIIDNTTDYLNASDVFVLPSLSEGLSIALLEAMSMGLPSIVTKVGCNTDLITTGFNGTVVLPGDTEGLKNALVLYLQNKELMKEHGKRSVSIIKERYSSIDRYVMQYSELWDRCLNNKV